MENKILKFFSPGTTSLDSLFRLGLSSFFLLNSLTAWFSPDEFLELLQSNPLASSIADPQFWVYIIGINDALLFLLILSGRWRKGIAIWAAIWIIGVVYMTISEGAMELIEHLGLLSFIAYYYLTFQQISIKQVEQRKFSKEIP